MHTVLSVSWICAANVVFGLRRSRPPHRLTPDRKIGVASVQQEQAVTYWTDSSVQEDPNGHAQNRKDRAVGGMSVPGGAGMVPLSAWAADIVVTSATPSSAEQGAAGLVVTSATAKGVALEPRPQPDLRPEHGVKMEDVCAGIIHNRQPPI